MPEQTEKAPQELHYVIDVAGLYSIHNPGQDVKVKRGPFGIFGTVTRNFNSVTVSGKHLLYGEGVIDISSAPRVLAEAEDLKRQMREKVEASLDNPPRPGIAYHSDVQAALWVGTADQFEPRPSHRGMRWSRRGELGAICLAGAEICEAGLAAVLEKFDTPERRRQQVQDAIAAAVAPPDVRAMKPLKLKGAK